MLVATAADPGAWGNNVRIDVDYNTTDPANFFNLTVTEIATANGATSVVSTETYRNVVADPQQAQRRGRDGECGFHPHYADGSRHRRQTARAHRNREPNDQQWGVYGDSRPNGPRRAQRRPGR